MPSVYPLTRSSGKIPPARTPCKPQSRLFRPACCVSSRRRYGAWIRVASGLLWNVPRRPTQGIRQSDDGADLLRIAQPDPKGCSQFSRFPESLSGNESTGTTRDLADKQLFLRRGRLQLVEVQTGDRAVHLEANGCRAGQVSRPADEGRQMQIIKLSRHKLLLKQLSGFHGNPLLQEL